MDRTGKYYTYDQKSKHHVLCYFSQVDPHFQVFCFNKHYSLQSGIVMAQELLFH